MRPAKRRILTLILVLTVIAASFNMQGNTGLLRANAATVKQAVCNVATLNIRKGPGTNYDKVAVNGVSAFMKQGEVATVTSVTTGWYGISFKFEGQVIEGYISSDYATLNEIDDGKGKETEDKTEKTDNKDKAAEKEQDTKSGSDKKDEKETGGAEAVTNGSVTVDGVKYTVIDGVYYDAFSCKGKVTTSSLRVRKGPGTNYDQVTYKNLAQSLKQGMTVTILARTYKNKAYWYKIQYKVDNKTITGYVSADYVTLQTQDGKACKVNGEINKKVYVRSKMGSGSSTIKTYNGTKLSFKVGKKVIIYGEKIYNGEKWFMVKFYYGTTLLKGYVKACYVNFRQTKSTVQPTSAAPSESTEAVSGSAVTGDGETGNTGNETANNDNNNSGSGSSTSSEPENPYLLKDAVVVGGPAELKCSAGKSFDTIRDGNGNPVILETGAKVVTYSYETDTEGNGWLLITYEKNGYYSAGYILLSNISFGTEVVTPANPTETVPATGVMDDAQFETYMSSQGFPESYKPYLRQLHAAHPYWEFRANLLGIDWETALASESMVGKNLITNGKNVSWKSLESGAYNWLSDKFIPFDGSTWVTASKDAVAYYMDPRNFLNDTEIFQFELLSYQPGYQTVAGVENILTGTPMNYASYSYVDESGNTEYITYADTFMKAAEYSGVSPYHLASRAKQEVVTGVSSMSSSVSGNVSGHEGYYNYYNIGATQSTAKGGAVANGLNYAENGNAGKTCTVDGVTMLFNDYIKIPWTDPYRSIVGGGAYIGINYIQRGQNTVYLEKFNMTPTSTFSHQYMSNVEAAWAESIKTSAAYSLMAQTPVIFSIPVYTNMPETPCPKPVDSLNPNNWLKSLEVDGYSLTPSFNASAEEQVYSVIVESDVYSVVISGTTASKSSTVTGLGEVVLSDGENTFPVIVTAENGDVKIYVINILRQ